MQVKKLLAISASLAITTLSACNENTTRVNSQPIRTQATFRTQTTSCCSGMTRFGVSGMDGLYAYNIVGASGNSNNADGVAGQSARVYRPDDIYKDSHGNLVFMDNNGTRIRVLAASTGTYFGRSMTANQVYNIVGDETQASSVAADGSNTQTGTVRINSGGFYIDSNDNIYLSDYENIRMIPATSGSYFGHSGLSAGCIYTIAGSGTSGNGNDARENLDATLVNLGDPFGVSLDSHGNIIFCDYNTWAVRIVPATTSTFYNRSMTQGYMYTLAGYAAGSGYSGANGSSAIGAEVQYPYRALVDANDNLFIEEHVTNKIRMVPVAGGSGGNYYGVSGMSAGHIYTILGNGGTPGCGDTQTGVAALSASFNLLDGMFVDGSGNIIFGSNAGNHGYYMLPNNPSPSTTIFGQKMTSGNVYRIVGTGGQGGDFGSHALAVSAYNAEASPFVDSNGDLYVGISNAIMVIPACS